MKKVQVYIYKENDLDRLNNVYSGGTYDIIILGGDDGISTKELSYIRIEFRNTDGEQDSVWISLPKFSASPSDDDTTSSTASSSQSSP